MVKGVKRLQPELHVHSFTVELEIPHYRDVPVVASWPAQRIPPQGAKHAGLIIREQLSRSDLSHHVGIEPRARRQAEVGINLRALLDLELAQRIAYHRAADTGRCAVQRAKEVDRRTHGEVADAAHLPAGKQVTRRSIGRVLEER